jgi:hypothetical protein
MGGPDSWDGLHCRCGKHEAVEVRIDPSRPVRVSAEGLKANPDFAGLPGSVTAMRAESVTVYFPNRGAASIWLADEIENVPLPLNHNRDERTKP